MKAKPYEFMVTYTPQEEWIESRGLLMWLSTFFVEVGAATFFIASLFHHVWSMLVGIILCGVLGGGLHFADLGQPMRFWKMLFSSSWRTSWIARGIWSINLFLVCGGMYLVLANIYKPIPWLLIISNVFALCTIIYFGFLMSYMNSLSLWNSALLPLLILLTSFWGGLDIFMLISFSTDNLKSNIVFWFQLFPLLVAITVFFYLFSVKNQNKSGKISFQEIVQKKWAPLFWVGFVFLGVLLPILAALTDQYLLQLSNPIIVAIIMAELGANLSLRYCLLKCANYEPIIPTNVYAL